MDWLFYHEINEYFVISLCLILNALQLTLALTERQQVVKVYCKLIVLNASTELCSTFCMALGRPILQFRNGLFVVVFLGREKDANLYLVFFFYAIGVGIGIITLLMDFLYRYMVVCRDTNVRLYHILSWTLIVYFFAAWDATFLTYGFYTSTEGTNATLHSIFTDVPCFLKLEDVPVLFTDVYNQYSRIFMVSALMITNTVYSVVFFTRHKVMTKLFSKKHVMSQRTKIMQNGLNNMLMAQAIVPIFTGLLPVIGIVLGMLSKTNNPSVGFTITMMFSYLPIVSPICTIYFITSFRQRLMFWRKLKRIDNHTSEIQASYTNTAQNGK